MSQELKTIAYLGVALIAAVVAFTVSREDREMTASDLEGTPLVELEDPLAVKGLRIVKVDADTGKKQPFEVTQVDGLYSIPSHQNYPADARDHLADAVNFVNGVKILSSVSDRSGSHEDFGVLDPDDDSSTRGNSGAGTRITMTDADGKPLADLIVGKEVKGHPGQYYVRYAAKDQVFSVALDPNKLSTKFEDWIERDLLKLDPLDLATVDIEDYSLQTEQRLELGNGGPQIVTAIGKDSKSDIQLAFDRNDLAWKLEKLELFEGKDGKPKVVTLTENEELNKEKLNDLKSALDDLEIVDVRKKIPGFDGDLLEFIKKDPKAAANLQRHGFYFAPKRSGGGFEMLSDNGQVTVGMSDGVEYVLRFGGVAGAEQKDGAEDKDATADGDKENPEKPKPEDPSGSGVLRYLFVMTQLQTDLIEKPELQEVPEETPPADKPVDEPVDEPKGNAGDENAEGKDTDVTSKKEPDERDRDNEPSDETVKREEEAKDNAENKSDNEDSVDEVSDEDSATKLEEWKAQREAILQSNGRAEKKYEAKIEDGKKRVAELNERFSDWYYVISDETYHKIHLGYRDIIKKKKADEADAEATPGGSTPLPASGLDQFNALKDLLPPVSDADGKQSPKEETPQGKEPTE